MASLIKKSNSPYWYAQFYTEQVKGEYKQHRISTRIRQSGLNKTDYLSNQKLARAEAEKIEERIKKKLPYNAQGREICDAVHAIMEKASMDALQGMLSVDKGKGYLVELTSLCSSEALVEHDLESWRDEFLRIKTTTDRISKASLAKYTQHFREFINRMSKDGKLKLMSVCSEDIENHKSELVAQGLSVGTVNAHLRSIKSYFKMAKKKNEITKSPADPVDFIKVKRADVLSRTPFKTDEINDLIAAAPSPEWKAFIKVGFYTGLRMGDISALKWSNITKDESGNHYISIVTEKTDEPVMIPLHSDELLKELRSLGDGIGIGEAPIFPALSQTQVGARDGLSKQFTDIMDHAKVGKGKVTEAGTAEDGKSRGRSRRQKSFHSLRGSFVSHLANADVPKEIRMKLTGHKDEGVHDIYTTIEAKTLKAGIQSLPQVG